VPSRSRRQSVIVRLAPAATPGSGQPGASSLSLGSGGAPSRGQFVAFSNGYITLGNLAPAGGSACGRHR
jgi:hypothetical protein